MSELSIQNGMALIGKSVGHGRSFVKNGVQYKRVLKTKSEKEAEELAKKLQDEHPSRRFQVIIERMHWTISNQSKLLNRWGSTSFRVYVPVMEKA